MFKLQGHFGALLWQSAFFERIGKLISFPNPHQKLRLRHKSVRVHAVFFGGSGERGEIHISSNVLLAWSFIRIGTDGMLT